jgi:hypothetical protein
MPFFTKPALQILLFTAALAGIALLAGAWRSARQDSQKLAATLAAQNIALQQASDREKQRDSQLAATLSAIQSAKRAVRTPQQAAEQIPKILPPLPLPVSVHIPNLTVPLPPGETQPPASVSIPQPDLVPLYDALQDCRSSEAQADALQKDLADEKARSAALTQQRNAAIAAAHGGTFLVRLKRAVKWFAIGIAVGAAATAAVRR